MMKSVKYLLRKTGWFTNSTMSGTTLLDTEYIMPDATTVIHKILQLCQTCER